MNKRPLIHCITNIVTVNDCANAVLAIGASPTMAHHPLEVAEIAENAGALVLNMGAMESYDAMMTAGLAAKSAGVPIVLDPVGAAGASYRREKTIELINEVKPDVIRGNYSEIKALYMQTRTIIGVDANEDEVVTESMMKSLAKRTGAVIAASGKIDYIADEDDMVCLTGGSDLMSYVTGTGCMSTALIGACLAFADKENEGTKWKLKATVDCINMVNSCASKAEEKTALSDGGTMTFRMLLIDEISKCRK